ncbi:MAG: DUF3560 domain-containing protein [Actinomycetota bacterium]
MREYSSEEADALASELEARAARRAELAAKRAADAVAAHRQADDAVAGIPFGQPVMPGQSGRRHRSALRRSGRAMGRAVDADRKRAYHQGKADRAAGRAVEVRRRAEGARYTRADLAKGDRLQLGNVYGHVHGVVVRVNAKSVTCYAVHTGPYDAAGLEPIWPQCEDLNPDRTPYLAVRAAWRLIDGVWVEVQQGGAS